ncbi:polyprotein [Phanerochaete sordida]|uniref:Polyprotein n=1 Tax=Phanerochaete sordida TaxID=48140 RepID=A0A9P3GSZ0_9APHY|nr:polyprotein [Phanerochaete sordida]
MYFGLCNSPATFQALMNHVFADLIAAGKVAVYLDDILIWSNDIASHRKIVHEVLERLAQYDLYLRPEKCEFERDEIEYLGLLIREGQVGMDPAKVKAVTEWPTPKNLKDVRGFVGFANFYRRFIKDFSKICRPLHDLTKKDVPFNWGSAQADAFETLKRAFTTQPVLAMWNIDYSTRIETDASGYATGGVIAQLDPNDKLWHSIAFRSQTMSPAERNYEIWDREMLAIIEALKDWRQFLEGLPEPFDIWTDHQNLQYWKTAQNLTRRQARWACYLAEYDFRIVYKPGKTHLIADPLSRPSSLYISDDEDNRSQIVLKPEQFKIAATAVFAKIAPLEKCIRDNSDKEQEVADALQTLRTKGPRRLQNGTLEHPMGHVRRIMGKQPLGGVVQGLQAVAYRLLHFLRACWARIPPSMRYEPSVCA